MTKRIAILLPNLKVGGAEKVAVLLSNEFIRMGYHVDILLCSFEGELINELHNDIKVINLESTRIRNSFKPLLAYLKQARPDSLLAFMWPLTLVAIVAFKVVNLPGRVIVSDHTTFSQSPLIKSHLRRWFLSGSLRALYPLADARLAVSSGVANDLANIGYLNRDTINVIYNPINLKVSSELRQSKKAYDSSGRKLIVAVGALKWAKNYPLLLRAFKILLSKQEANLVIVGQGELLSELELLARELNIEDWVQFVGFSKTPILWMSSADLLVLSSHYEGFGNVLVEAMSVGTPVVSTNCKSGPNEILQNGKYGKLVPVDDANTLAEAMYKSLHEKHNIEALKNRAKAFSVDKIAKQYLDIMFPKRVKINE